MAEARDIEKVKLLTGETNENLIEAYLEEAADFVKSYTECDYYTIRKSSAGSCCYCPESDGNRRGNFQKRGRGKLFI